MPIYNNSAQYVKFVRGTPTAFSNLANKDGDTLYFISENNASTGLLYLGTKLISGSVSTTDLGTVILNNLGDGDILVYDITQSAWINIPPDNLVTVMRGATAARNGVSGLVPMPVAGDQTKFLRGDGTWATPPQSVLSNTNFEQNNSGEYLLKGFASATVGQLPVKSENGLQWIDTSSLSVDLTEINERIANLTDVVNGVITTKLQRKIVASINAINTSASDADRYIYMVPNTDSTDGHNYYSEYMVIDGQLELIGNNYEGDLTGYVTSIVFNTAVGDLNSSITNIQNDLRDLSSQFDDYVTLVKYNNEVGDLQNLLLSQNNGNTLVHQVNDLTMRLTWNFLD